MAVSSSLLIAQADLAAVRLIRAAIAPSDAGGCNQAGQTTTRVIKGQRMVIHRSAGQNVDILHLRYDNTTSLASAPASFVRPSAESTRPPVDPGATDLRDAHHRRTESPLQPPWAVLPDEFSSTPKAAFPHGRQIKIMAYRTDTTSSGTTIDLFC